MPRVIIFGPTGNIGSVAAQTARELGAEVILAMRDVQKSIPGLSSNDEQRGGYERVQADLTVPESVAAAVTKTRATRAFFYVAHGSPDYMKGSIQAMKTAGIEFAVLLSSYTIDRRLQEIEPSDRIAYMHAQVEIVLDEVYGQEHYVAMRPGGFVTNLLRYQKGIVSGDVRLLGSAMEIDAITPGDMGRASAAVLVNGPKNGQTKVYLYGPQVVTIGEALKVIGEVMERDMKITEIDEKEGLEQLTSNGIPKPVAEYFARRLVDIQNGGPQPRMNYEEGVKNVQLYTGRPSTGLKEWIEANRTLFN